MMSTTASRAPIAVMLEDGAIRARLPGGSRLPLVIEPLGREGRPVPVLTSDADMDHVRDAVWKNMVFIPWQKGDVLAIDSFAVSHGRMPCQGPRAVAVAWA